MASCDSDANTDTATGTPSPVAIGSGQGNGSNHPLNELAASASEHAIDSPPLLRIRNKTTEVVVLTSADNQNTANVDPGKSLQLMSRRACRWIPLRASTTDGKLIDEYTEPCRGQTWTITDN